MNMARSGSGNNGLSPNWRQAITRSNSDLLSTEQTLVEFERNTKIFIHENAYEYVVCEITGGGGGDELMLSKYIRDITWQVS